MLYRSDVGSLDFGRQIRLEIYLLIFLAAICLCRVLSLFMRSWADWQPALLLMALACFLVLLVWLIPSARLIVGALIITGAAAFWFYSQPVTLSVKRAALIVAGAAAAGMVFALTGFDVEPLAAVTVQPPRSLWWTPLLLFASLLIGLIAGLLGRKDATAETWWRYAAGAAILLHVVLLSALMVARVRALYTPTYDFGIFAQMFHNMRETGLPLTTLERSRDMSHFAVHVSPIFYLWLPFYAVLPRPETLQVLQILTVASGVVPLYLIARDKLAGTSLPYVLAIVYLFHPGIIGSSMYDVHENAFLAPLILWLLWAADRRKIWLYFLFMLLILAVKEDAALYVISVGIFLIPDKNLRMPALLSIIMSFAVFFLVSRHLNNAGEGVMTYRFANLVTDERWGLPGVVLTLLINPGYALSEMFSAEKLHYLQKMILPLAFLPFLQRRLRHFALLIPLIVMNLISRYQYQANIGFQYHYATAALLFYLAILFLAGMPRNLPARSKHTIRLHPRACVTALMLSAAVLFGSMLFGAYASPIGYVARNREMLDNMRADMDAIEEDATVRATTFLTTYLSNRPFIIDLSYEHLDDADDRTADYLVFDLRRRLGSDLQSRLDDAKKSYAVFRESDSLLILKRTD